VTAKLFHAASRGARLLATGAILLILAVVPAQAAVWNSVLEEVIVILTSGWARGIAIIAIILSGLGLMVNMVHLRTAVFIVLGVILVFGAPSLVDLLIGAAQGT